MSALQVIVRLLMAGEAVVLVGFGYQGYIWFRQWRAWRKEHKGVQNGFGG